MITNINEFKKQLNENLDHDITDEYLFAMDFVNDNNSLAIDIVHEYLNDYTTNHYALKQYIEQ